NVLEIGCALFEGSTQFLFPARSLATTRQVACLVCEWHPFVQFRNESSQRNQNREWLFIPSSRLDAYCLGLTRCKTRNLRNSSRELRQISRRGAERILQVDCHLCGHERLAVEVVQTSNATRSKNAGLHEVLQVLRADAEHRACLFQLQFSVTHQDLNCCLYFRR